MSDDKRRFPRFVVEGVHGKMVFASRVDVLNLSLGGVAIKADRRLNIGAVYTLKLEVGASFVSVKGVVVWSVLSGIRHENGESFPQYSAGLRFTDVLTDKLESLIAFIDQHKISEEHRLSGIRFQIRAPGKAVLDSPAAYKVRLISLSGMLIETDAALELESRHPMELLPPALDPIRFTGRVASCIDVLDESQDKYEIGIEFVEMAPDDRQRLQRFIESISR